LPKPMRHDFATASVGLTLPAQHKNLGKLHDWLIDEVQIDVSEQVEALTNYQQGRFGRLPSHILLVTTARVAFTHDGGLRAIPLSDLYLGRVGLRVGLTSGEMTLVLRSGEELTFRRGMSMAMQEVASALQTLAAWELPASLPARSSDGPGPSSPQEVPDTAGFAGRGDDVIQFNAPIEGLQALRIRGGSSTEAFSVWALSPTLEPQELLVNASDPYSGVCVAGTQGPIGGLQINAEGRWNIEALDPEDLPVLDGHLEGTGDAVTFVRPELGMLEQPQVLRVQATSRGHVAMWAYGMTPALLINNSGSYSGTVIVPAGTQLLAFTCGGPWTLSG
jgi:hypothetical protein